MIFYFDQRNFTGIYVKVIVDGNTFGYTYLQKNKITSIIIPNNTKKVELYYSYKKNDDCKKIKRKVVESAKFPYKVQNISMKYYKEIKDIWKFPYYSAINIEKINDDICFFPEMFAIDGLKGVMYYNACLYTNKAKVNFLLKKDCELNIKMRNIRKKDIALNIVGTVISIIIALLSLCQIFFCNLSNYYARYIAQLAIVSVLFVIVCFHTALDSYRFRGMIDFNKIHDEINM